MRLIDKETLCGLLADKALEAQLEDECTELAIKECLSIVRRMPEAVVRCRECKYWGDEDGKSQREDGVLFARCNVHNYLIDGRHTGWCPTENDFCSCGEEDKHESD